jgi:hypothetical protein
MDTPVASSAEPRDLERFVVIRVVSVKMLARRFPIALLATIRLRDSANLNSAMERFVCSAPPRGSQMCTPQRDRHYTQPVARWVDPSTPSKHIKIDRERVAIDSGSLG